MLGGIFRNVNSITCQIFLIFTLQVYTSIFFFCHSFYKKSRIYENMIIKFTERPFNFYFIDYKNTNSLQILILIIFPRTFYQTSHTFTLKINIVKQRFFPADYLKRNLFFSKKKYLMNSSETFLKSSSGYINCILKS